MNVGSQINNEVAKNRYEALCFVKSRQSRVKQKNNLQIYVISVVLDGIFWNPGPIQSYVQCKNGSLNYFPWN